MHFSSNPFFSMKKKKNNRTNEFWYFEWKCFWFCLWSRLIFSYVHSITWQWKILFKIKFTTYLYYVMSLCIWNRETNKSQHDHLMCWIGGFQSVKINVFSFDICVLYLETMIFHGVKIKWSAWPFIQMYLIEHMNKPLLQLIIIFHNFHYLNNIIIWRLTFSSLKYNHFNERIVIIVCDVIFLQLNIFDILVFF